MKRLIQRWQTPLLLASLALSGYAALSYQILWIRRLQFAFGGTSKATAAGLAIFMAGLALGSWLYGRRDRKDAWRAYALLELGLGLSALLADRLLDLLPQLIAAHADRAWLSGLAWPLLSALALLVPACFSGATLPAATDALQESSDSGDGFSRAYALNLLGAALGSLLAGLWLIPALGLGPALLIAAACNIFLGLLLLAATPQGGRSAPLSDSSGTNALLAASLLSGACAFMLELLWTRALALSLGASSPALSLMLGASLSGIFLGAWAYQRWRPLANAARPWAAKGYATLAGLILLQALLLGLLPRAQFAMLLGMDESGSAYRLGLGTAAFGLLLLVTLPQGLLFPALLAGRDASPGRMLAANSLGAVSGVLLAAWVGIPLLGLQPLFAVAAALALSAACLLAWPTWGSSWRRLGPAAVLALLLLAPWFKPWDPKLVSVGMPHHGASIARNLGAGESLDSYLNSFTVQHYDEDAEGVVSVLERGRERALAVNGKQESANADRVTQKLLAHLPLGLHPAPTAALVIGWGSGGTAGSASLHPLSRLLCVELNPKVLSSAPFFEGQQLGVMDKPFFEARVDDARHALVVDPALYDVVISGPSNPWLAGVANLFSTDFYSLLKQRLRPGGLLAQWFQLYDMDEATLKLQLRTFAASYPQVSVWILPPSRPGPAPSDLLLLGAMQPLSLSAQALQPLFRSLAPAADLRSVQVTSPAMLLASLLLDDAGVRRYAGTGPLNSDRQPRLEYSAANARRQAHSRAATLQPLGQARRQLILGMEAASAWSLPQLEGAELLAYSEAKRRLGLRAHALAAAERAVSIGPRNADARLALGQALQDLGRPDAARRELQQAIKMAPSLGQAWVSLGTLELDAKRHSEAAAVFAGMRRRFPGIPDPLFGEASAWIAAKRKDKAAPLVAEFKKKFWHLKQAEILERALAGLP